MDQTQTTHSRHRRALVIGTVAVAAAFVAGGVAGAAMRDPKTKIVVHRKTVTPKSCADALREYDRYHQVVSEQFLQLPVHLTADSNGSDPSANLAAQLQDLSAAYGKTFKALPPGRTSTDCLNHAG